MRKWSGRVLLLHGFTGSQASWPSSCLEALRAVGLEPVPVDLPGHGAEVDRRPDGAGFRACRDVVLEASGGEAVDLVGYSMGGRIALRVAIEQQGLVRRLVLESASPGLESAAEQRERRASDSDLARNIIAEGIEDFVARWERLPLFASQVGLSADVLQAQRARRLANDPDALAWALRELGTGALPSAWEHLEQVLAPALLLVGSRDEKFMGIAHRMLHRWDRAKVEVIRGVGHTVHLEAPDLWSRAVTRFLTLPDDSAPPHR